MKKRRVKNLKKKGGEDLKKCFQCATCPCVCNLSPKDNAFPRKEMLWATWGLKDKLMNDADVWLCHYCNDCTIQCPRGAKPGNTMAAIRYSIIEENAVPKFMGKAYASPKNLAWLLLLPFILFAVFFYSRIFLDRREYIYIRFSIIFTLEILERHQDEQPICTSNRIYTIIDNYNKRDFVS